MISKFSEYINESIRGKMKPIGDGQIKKLLDYYRDKISSYDDIEDIDYDLRQFNEESELYSNYYDILYDILREIPKEEIKKAIKTIFDEDYLEYFLNK